MPRIHAWTGCYHQANHLVQHGSTSVKRLEAQIGGNNDVAQHVQGDAMDLDEEDPSNELLDPRLTEEEEEAEDQEKIDDEDDRDSGFS